MGNREKGRGGNSQQRQRKKVPPMTAPSPSGRRSAQSVPLPRPANPPGSKWSPSSAPTPLTPSSLVGGRLRFSVRRRRLRAPGRAKNPGVSSHPRPRRHRRRREASTRIGRCSLSFLPSFRTDAAKAEGNEKRFRGETTTTTTGRGSEGTTTPSHQTSVSPSPACRHTPPIPPAKSRSLPPRFSPLPFLLLLVFPWPKVIPPVRRSPDKVSWERPWTTTEEGGTGGGRQHLLILNGRPRKQGESA